MFKRAKKIFVDNKELITTSAFMAGVAGGIGMLSLQEKRRSNAAAHEARRDMINLVDTKFQMHDAWKDQQ